MYREVKKFVSFPASFTSQQSADRDSQAESVRSNTSPHPDRRSSGCAVMAASDPGYTLKRTKYLPVISALAETFLPASPDKAFAAEKQGQHDFAQLQAYGGGQQPAQVEKVSINDASVRIKAI